MIEMFYPDVYVDSTYLINYEKLYESGFRGIVFDIDNTLVPHGAPADERSRELMDRLRRIGYKIMMISNNKEPRVKSFCDVVRTEYIYKANKPFKSGYLKAMERMQTKPSQTLFVGDQLFTDVWGAKRVGMTTYLVKPIHPKEEIQIVLKRYLEKLVLASYSKYKKDKGEVDNGD